MRLLLIVFLFTSCLSIPSIDLPVGEHKGSLANFSLFSNVSIDENKKLYLENHVINKELLNKHIKETSVNHVWLLRLHRSLKVKHISQIFMLNVSRNYYLEFQANDNLIATKELNLSVPPDFSKMSKNNNFIRKVTDKYDLYIESDADDSIMYFLDKNATVQDLISVMTNKNYRRFKTHLALDFKE